MFNLASASAFILLFGRFLCFPSHSLHNDKLNIVYWLKINKEHIKQLKILQVHAGKCETQNNIINACSRKKTQKYFSFFLCLHCITHTNLVHKFIFTFCFHCYQCIRFNFITVTSSILNLCFLFFGFSFYCSWKYFKNWMKKRNIFSFSFSLRLLNIFYR